MVSNKKISKPVNKNISSLLKRKYVNKSKANSPKTDTWLKGVSIITCTCKPNSLSTIISNFIRQKHHKKELIIIINNNNINISDWTKKTSKHNNINIYQIDENITLGECLNYAVKKTAYGIIAKFDDDDYYGSEYLQNSVKLFYTTNANIIGKSTYFVYFNQNNQLAINRSDKENKYVNFIAGPTIIFNKKVFAKVKFRKLNLGEDKSFLQDCLSVGFKIYSSDRYDFVYFRYQSKDKHTWKIDPLC